VRLGPDQVSQVPANGRDSCNAENTEEKLSETASEFQAESHPVVLGKVNDKPVAKHMKLLAEVHMSLDPDFNNLVNEQN
jgi:hypothetical protein